MNEKSFEFFVLLQPIDGIIQIVALFVACFILYA